MNAQPSPAPAAKVAASPAPPPVARPAARTREAALLLHAMSAPDRAWLLAQLAEADRAVIEPLLSELEALGIPADRALVSGVVAPAQAAPAAPASAAPPASGPLPAAREATDPSAMLDRADPALVAEVLRREPAGLVARLLSLREWRWQDASLAAMGEAERRRVEDLVARASPRGALPGNAPGAAAALHDRLVTKLLERVRALEEERGAARGGGPPGARRPSLVSRLLRRRSTR